MKLLTVITLLAAFALACSPAATSTPAPTITIEPQITPEPEILSHVLKVKANPEDAAEFLFNPLPIGQGLFVHGRTVTIDVLPQPGWVIDEWVGPVFAVAGRTAKIKMDSSQSVVVRLVQEEVPTLVPPTPTPTAVPTHTPAATPTPTPFPAATPQSSVESTPVPQKVESRTAKRYSGPPQMTIDPATKYTAIIKTNHGDIVITLFASSAPKTVNNFVFLANEGFYNGVIFHRVIPNFMIQGGDPTGTGTSGPGYKFEDEIDPTLGFDRPGILAMANAGPNTNGSQFFITVVPTPHLNGAHTIFGQVFEGQEVADSISKAPADANNRPTQPVIIQSIKITKTRGPTLTPTPTPTPVPPTPTPTPTRVPTPTPIPRYQLFINEIPAPPSNRLMIVTGGTVTLSPHSDFDGRYAINTRVTMVASSTPGSQVTWGGVDTQRGAFGIVEMVADRFVTLSIRPPTATPLPTPQVPTPIPTRLPTRVPTSTPVYFATPTPTPLSQSISITPSRGSPPLAVTVIGTNYAPGTYSITYDNVSVGTVSTTGGLWVQSFLVPASALGSHTVKVGSASATFTVELTISPTPTPLPKPTPTTPPTATPLPAPTPTPLPTPTPTPVPTPTPTPVPTPTPLPTATPTPTPVPTPTAVPTFVLKWGSFGTGDGQFNNALAVAVDGAGNVYVADTGNDRIQKFDSSGNFLTSIVSAEGQFNNPNGVAVDSLGNVYVVKHPRILKFDSSGNFVTEWGSLGTGDGQLDNPWGVAVDGAGNVYVTERGNHRIQKFDSSGNFLAKWGSLGSGDGRFNNPMAVAVDSSGNVYVGDSGLDRIQKFDSSGSFLTKWGSLGSGDGQFDDPTGVALDGSGNVYVSDKNNQRIQKFDSSGNFLTKWGSFGTGDGQFNNPWGVAVDGTGNIYVMDFNNHRVQKFASGN